MEFPRTRASAGALSFSKIRRIRCSIALGSRTAPSRFAVRRGLDLLRRPGWGAGHDGIGKVAPRQLEFSGRLHLVDTPDRERARRGLEVLGRVVDGPTKFRHKLVELPRTLSLGELEHQGFVDERREIYRGSMDPFVQ